MNLGSPPFRRSDGEAPGAQTLRSEVDSVMRVAVMPGAVDRTNFVGTCPYRGGVGGDQKLNLAAGVHSAAVTLARSLRSITRLGTSEVNSAGTGGALA